jgi:broad specificity phosphatase PhoE
LEFSRVKVWKKLKIYPELYKQREKDKWNFIIPEGESFKDAYERIKKFIEKKIRKEFDGKSVVFVTHATLINLLLIYFSKNTVANIRNNFIKEASCILINIDDAGKAEVRNICLD